VTRLPHLVMASRWPRVCGHPNIDRLFPSLPRRPLVPGRSGTAWDTRVFVCAVPRRHAHQWASYAMRRPQPRGTVGAEANARSPHQRRGYRVTRRAK
jgi:hypothetical protein